MLTRGAAALVVAVVEVDVLEGKDAHAPGELYLSWRLYSLDGPCVAPQLARAVHWNFRVCTSERCSAGWQADGQCLRMACSCSSALSHTTIEVVRVPNERRRCDKFWWC